MPFDSLTHLAKHLRHLLKRDGIAARCRVAPGGGSVQVFPVAHGIEFSDDHQRHIRTLAVHNKLTCVRGLLIDVERMTDPHGMEFYL